MKRERYLALGVFLLIMAMCLALPVIATAAAPPSTVNTPQITTEGASRIATLTWTAPTLYTDGTPITETISYNVYEGLCSLATLPKVLTTSELTAVRINQPAGDMCYQLSAQTPAGGESDRTARGSKTFPFSRPNTVPTLTVN